MNINIELTESDLRRLVLREIREQLGDATQQIKEQDIQIQIKSKQNFKAEWDITRPSVQRLLKLYESRL